MGDLPFREGEWGVGGRNNFNIFILVRTSSMSNSLFFPHISGTILFKLSHPHSFTPTHPQYQMVGPQGFKRHSMYTVCMLHVSAQTTFKTIQVFPSADSPCMTLLAANQTCFTQILPRYDTAKEFCCRITDAHTQTGIQGCSCAHSERMIHMPLVSEWLHMN